jgi:hypothetical protein
VKDKKYSKKNAKGNVIKNKKHNGLKSIKSFNFSLIIFNELLSSKKANKNKLMTVLVAAPKAPK